MKRYRQEERSYSGEAADAEALRRRRDLDDLERILVLFLLLPLPVPPVLVLPAHHRETRLRLGEAAVEISKPDTPSLLHQLSNSRNALLNPQRLVVQLITLWYVKEVEATMAMADVSLARLASWRRRIRSASM